MLIPQCFLFQHLQQSEEEQAKLKLLLEVAWSQDECNIEQILKKAEATYKLNEARRAYSKASKEFDEASLHHQKVWFNGTEKALPSKE